MPLLLDKRQPDNAYLQEIAAFLGIDSRLNHLPHELSGGQQQRVAIARALIAKPDIIFADEPTGNLDTKSGSEVMEMLCDLRAKMNKTLIVIIRKYTQHSKRMQMQMPLKVGWTTGVANSRERTGSLTVKAATKWRRALHKSRCCAGY